MDGLRNPFAVRNGNIILIEDISKSERGLKCQCKCPSCNGDFIARLGDVKIHHFAHSKEACDEVVAYTTGLYKLIHQVLKRGVLFYVMCEKCGEIKRATAFFSFGGPNRINLGYCKSCRGKQEERNHA